jgi:GWxTD domain-containing protein
MRYGLTLVICSAFGLLGVQSRAADTKKDDPSQLQKRETIAKPPTERQKKKAEERQRKELESPYKKWLDEEVGWIITDEERQAFSRLKTDDERQQFIEDFWLKRDPTPDTEENEYKEEHYRRIAWANDRFASGVPGWKTDRGMIYIKFGPPDEIDDHSSGGPGSRSIEEGGGETTFYPYQVWRYRHIDGVGDDVQIEFVDQSLTNEFHMTMDPSEKDALTNVEGAGLTLYEQLGLADKQDRFTRSDGTHLGVPSNVDLPSRMNQWERLNQFVNLQKAPALKFPELEAAINSTIKYNLLPFRVRTDFFPITGASVMTSLVIQFDRKDLQYKQTDGVAEATVDIRAQIETMTHRRVVQPIEDVIKTLPVPVDMLQQSLQGSAVYQKNIPLMPGRYRLTVVAKDVVGGNMQTYDVALDVPRFEDDELATSSLILADQLERVPTNSIGTGPFVIGTSKVRPRVDATFKRSEKMGIYLQIYNFEPDAKTNKPDGTVQFEITKNGSDQPVAEFTQDVTEMSRGAAQVVVEKLVPLQNFEPGDYTVRLKITDKRRNEVVTPSASFKVI